MKTKLKFPFVKAFRDYHEIDAYCYDLNEIFVERISAKQVAFGGAYWALFYVGRKPSNYMIHTMLTSAGWDSENPDDFYPKGMTYI
ncbi:MAG: hypothetical protein KGI71_06175 [Patescibacteria group bacterium]|nr:hypothetical protein [Patescibacteria group bacterium]